MLLHVDAAHVEEDFNLLAPWPVHVGPWAECSYNIADTCNAVAAAAVKLAMQDQNHPAIPAAEQSQHSAHCDGYITSR